MFHLLCRFFRFPSRRHPRCAQITSAPGVPLPVSEYLLPSEQGVRKRRSSAGRIGLLTSLAAHLALFLFAIFYVTEKHHLEESHIAVEITTRHEHPLRARHRVTRPISHRTSMYETLAYPEPERSFTTDAQIPVVLSDGVIVLETSLPAQSQMELPQLDWGQIHRSIGSIRQEAEVRTLTSTLTTTPPYLTVAVPSQTTATSSLDLTIVDASAVIPLSETTRPPRFSRRVVPEYPRLAKQAGKEGVVLLEATIGTDGCARGIRVVRGLGMGCDEAAIVALRAARFSPAYQGNRPVAVRIQIPYRFQIDQT